MISSRFLPAACVLIAITLVPTLIHSYAGAVEVDGRTTAAIPAFLAGFTSTDAGRNATWGKRRFDSDDWSERNYRNGVDVVRLTVVRSYDPKSLYHHPELAVAYPTGFEQVDTRRLAGRPEIPVHVLTPGPGVNARAMYVLHYDGGFVENPIPFQIRTAAELLVGRRKPMTLFFVLDAEPAADTDVERSGAATLLFAAIDSFLKQQGAAPASGS